MAKIIKNPTEFAIPIKNMGITIPANGQYYIEPAEYRLWVELAVVSEVTPILNAASLVVNDGIEDLNVVDGKNFLLYPDFAKSQRFEHTTFVGDKQFTKKTTQGAIEESFPLIKKDGSPVDGTVREIDFTGSAFSVTSAVAGKVTISQDVTTLPGKIINFVFVNVGTTSNKWLEYGSSSASSDTTPYVSPFGGSLVGLTYMNKTDDTNTDVKIYKNGSLLFTWEIRGKRWAYKTNISAPQPSLNQGDKISVFFKKVNGASKPNTPTIDMLFQVSSAPLAEGGGQTGVV